MAELQVLRRVGFFCALFTAQCCVSVLGNISRDTIFLRSYRASSVAALTLGLSLTTAYALTWANQQLARLARRQARAGVVYALGPAVIGAGLAALAVASLALPLLARGVAVAIYTWVEIAAQLMTQQFWDLCAKAFDVSQSKKFFGFITFGTTFGSLLASFVVLPVLQRYGLPTEFNLLVASAMLFLVAAVLLVSADHFVPPPSMNGSGTSSNKAPARKARSPGSDDDEGKKMDPSASSAIIAEIQVRTYLKHICFFDLLATVIRVLIDNSTLSILSLQDEDEVKASLTMINGVQSFLMIPMQLASGPFFTHFGVMYGISLLPVTVLLFGVSTFASSSVYSVVVTRALYNAISLAIFNPARELLWLPFDVSARSRLKSFVCGPFRSLSRIFGAVLSMALTSGVAIQLLGGSSMSILMSAASVAWFVDALAARKSYAAEFYASLRQGYLDLSSPLIDFTPDQIVLVKEALVNGAQHQANFVLSSLSHEHIALFAQELRALFYKKARDDVSLTPLHTKLRLLNLHTAAKRQFVLQSQGSYLAPDVSAYPTGIFNTMDLMMMVKDKSVATPRQLRVAAILACGYERLNADADKCSAMLRKLLQSDEEKSVVVCVSVALLRLSDWMDEEANVILQKLLHEEKELESRVMALRIIGKELPELLGDGYLVYLLHHSSPQIVQAAVECCSNSARNSRMLIPALVKHLPNAVLRTHVVEALKWFDPSDLWEALYQYTDDMVGLSKRGNSMVQYPSTSREKREALSGALKVVEAGSFPLEDKLSLLLHLVETLMVGTKVEKAETEERQAEEKLDVLQYLFGKDDALEELVVDALISLVAGVDEKVIQSYSQLMDPLHHALNTKIREAYDMRHVLRLFTEICPRTAANIEETSPLLLQHVEHSLKDATRVLLKLLSIGFPKEFNVAVILEGLQSDLSQVHSAIQEVLENLLPSPYKGLVLPLLFPQVSSKANAKMMKKTAEFFGGKTGVEVLLDTMKHQPLDLELASLALQYFLHIAADHSTHLNDEMKESFQHDIIPQLLKDELTKELLVETYHSRMDVLPYESLADLHDSEPPLISRIAISNCLRVSSLFENVCAIGILRVLSHHFVPLRFLPGATFVVENIPATAMYIVASGQVQLHKEGRVLAELGFGSCVGQAALLQHSQHAGVHIASATAVTECIVLSISRASLDSLMKETPSLSRGVLNAVASSLRWLYYEPLRAIAQSGSLPRRDRSASVFASSVPLSADGTDPIENLTKSLTTNIKAALSVDRAAKSFLYNVGRSRSSMPLSAPGSGRGGRNRSLSGSPTPSGSFRTSFQSLSRGVLGLPDTADYTNFEKCIHLKGSQLMKSLDDEKVSLVAQLSRVVMLSHGDMLCAEGSNADAVYVVIEGTVAITKSQSDGTEEAAVVVAEMREGDCFGEESFVAGAKMNGTAASLGRSTLFEITTKELVDLGESHHDIMHQILAWLSQKLAKSTESMVAPLLSPPSRGSPRMWGEEEHGFNSKPTPKSRAPKWRAESD